jgi:hypothetical protein
MRKETEGNSKRKEREEGEGERGGEEGVLGVGYVCLVCARAQKETGSMKGN